MTKRMAMAINSKNLLKSSSPRTKRPMFLKLGVKHQSMELYKVYTNHDPWMTFTYFTARPTEVALAFEWGKLLKYDLKGKICRKRANRQNIYVYEKILSPGGYIPLSRGYIYVLDHNIQTSSALKPLGRSKPTLCGALLGSGDENCV